MEMEFDVKIERGDLLNYQLYHAYTGLTGLIGTLAAILFLILYFKTQQVLCLIFGLILLLYFPWTLNIQAAKQAKAPVFRKPLHYRLTDEGMTVSQGEEDVTVGWDQFTKALSTGRSLVLYTSKVNAYIFPKRELGEKMPVLIEFISKKLPADRVKIRSIL